MEEEVRSFGEGVEIKERGMRICVCVCCVWVGRANGWDSLFCVLFCVG